VVVLSVMFDAAWSGDFAVAVSEEKLLDAELSLCAAASAAM